MTTSERPQSERLKAPKSRETVVNLNTVSTRGKESLIAIGEVSAFTAEAVRNFPSTIRLYGSEVFRQAGILVLSSGLIIWFMMFIIGGQCGLEASYTMDQLGAPLYSAVFNAYCGFREMAYYMWAWILAAKVGCGYVAEVGSMRISDEVDAMEVMGIKSVSYLVSTRLLAMLLAGPFLFTVGIGVVFTAEFFVTVLYLGQVSTGGYQYIFWMYQNPYDFFSVLVRTILVSMIIVAVALYYGYTARGGPVGVGRATAKSMVVNLIVITALGLIATLIIWGADVQAPVAN